jgi:hypothetical protein
MTRSGITIHPMSSESPESVAVDESAAKAGLKEKIKRWDKWGTRFAFLVCVGLFMEYSLPWLSVEARYWLSSWITHWPYLHLMQIAHFFVVAGVAGELLAHRKQSNSSDDLTRIQERESDALKLQVAAANERAATAQLSLEKFKAPRTLTVEQYLNLRSAIESIGIHAVDFFIVGSSIEIYNFARTIERAFMEAKWEMRDWSTGPGLHCTGVVITTATGAFPDAKYVAMLIGKYLADIGVDSGTGPEFGNELPGVIVGPTWDKTKIAPIRIWIGEKPQQ